jgi:hypothetical protein
VYAHADHDSAETAAIDGFRAALTRQLQPLRDARDATPRTEAG